MQSLTRNIQMDNNQYRPFVTIYCDIVNESGSDTTIELPAMALSQNSSPPLLTKFAITTNSNTDLSTISDYPLHWTLGTTINNGAIHQRTSNPMFLANP